MAVSTIDKFLKSYSKEYDFYQKLAQICANNCETQLENSGIRAIVTYRAKRPDRLKEKLEKRNCEKKYKTVESIYKDIVDLAGVRIAIYFPGDREEIDKLITNNYIVHSKKKFPGEEQPSYTKRFSGYWAYHYRVSLKEETLGESTKRYSEAIIEIQVASVLMHAWAEVEHDLVYKPLSGELSEEEYQILDELNGLVLSGEIALERLQKAAKSRISGNGKKFNNHYELSSYLYDSIKERIHKENFEPIMGRADILFKFLQYVELDNPDKIEAYIKDLDADTEKRPIIDQLVDRIVLGSEEYYKFYNKAKNEVGLRNPYSNKNDKLSFLSDQRALGYFMSRWILFESVVRGLFHKMYPNSLQLQTANFRFINNLDLFDDSTIMEITHLRRIRNEVVHGRKILSDDTLLDAGKFIDNLLNQLLLKVPEEYRKDISEAIRKIS